MSSGEEWANDADTPGWGCWPRLSLLVAALVALLVVVLAACRTSTEVPPVPVEAPPAPTTGVLPLPPATATVLAAVRVTP